MRVKDKKEALFLYGCVIPCGLKDKTNDKALGKEDIKKIFTNYLTHETDVEHSWVKNFNVYNLENTLLTQDTKIAGKLIPKDSWVAGVMVTNPDIKQMIRNQDLNGYSIGAVSDKGLNENQHFLNKSLRYEDLNDYDELNPLFISLVDKPAHGLPWEVYDYDSFLAKSMQSDNMTENKEPKIEMSEGLFERIFGGFLKKSVEETIEKSEEEEKEESEEVVEKAEPVELSEETINLIADAVIQKLQEMAEKEAPQEEELEKECKEEDKVEKSEETPKDEDVKLEKSEETTEEEVKLEKSEEIVKQSSKIIETPVQETKTPTRDMYGRKLKYL